MSFQYFRITYSLDKGYKEEHCALKFKCFFVLSSTKLAFILKTGIFLQSH